MLVEGKQYPRGDIKRIVYGSYALVHAGTKNNLDSRTVPAVALRDSNNSGGHYFMSLISSKCMHANNWEELPITNEIIEKVHTIAKIKECHTTNSVWTMCYWEMTEIHCPI